MQPISANSSKKKRQTLLLTLFSFRKYYRFQYVFGRFGFLSRIHQVNDPSHTPFLGDQPRRDCWRRAQRHVSPHKVLIDEIDTQHVNVVF